MFESGLQRCPSAVRSSGEGVEEADVRAPDNAGFVRHVVDPLRRGLFEEGPRVLKASGLERDLASCVVETPEQPDVRALFQQRLGSGKIYSRGLNVTKASVSRPQNEMSRDLIGRSAFRQPQHCRVVSDLEP